jgi:predicted transposase YbfD/YdcC
LLLAKICMDSSKLAPTPPADWLSCFSEISDPRREQGTYHALRSIIGIALLAVLCGANDWEAIAAYGEEKADWLGQFLDMPCGVPSADTFERVFQRIDPAAFESGFRQWVSQIIEPLGVKVVAMDGKTHRGSYDRETKLKALHTVSAWSSEHRLVLAEVAVSSKSNEITAIPQLLDLLELAGAVVTMDAMGTQKTIAQQIRTQKADYVLSLKPNHPNLYQAVDSWFKAAQAKAWQGIVHQTTASLEDGHHRHEQRQLWAVPVSQFVDDPVLLAELAQWQDCQTVVVVWRRRETWKDISTEIQFYLASLDPDAKRLMDLIRGHWSIENQLHWSLDVVFQEDQARSRKGHSPRNFGMLRRLALNLLNRETTFKASLKRKRYKALLNNNYLCSILAAAFT